MKGHGGHVADAPLLRGRSAGGLDAAEEQRAEAVAAVQRAVAAAPDVGDAAPVDELVPAARRDEHVPGARAGQRVPQAAETVGVGGARDPPVAERELERGVLAVDAPRAS